MQRMQADDARAGVGDADELEQLLDGAVLAVAAVQRDERDVGRAPRAGASTRSAPTSIAIDARGRGARARPRRARPSAARPGARASGRP